MDVQIEQIKLMFEGVLVVIGMLFGGIMYLQFGARVARLEQRADVHDGRAWELRRDTNALRTGYTELAGRLDGHEARGADLLRDVVQLRADHQELAGRVGALSACVATTAPPVDCNDDRSTPVAVSGPSIVRLATHREFKARLTLLPPLLSDEDDTVIGSREPPPDAG